MAFEDLVGPAPAPEDPELAAIKLVADKIGVAPEQLIEAIAKNQGKVQPTAQSGGISVYPQGTPATDRGSITPTTTDPDELYQAVMQRENEPALITKAVLQPPNVQYVPPVQPLAIPSPVSEDNKQVEQDLQGLLQPTQSDGPPSVTDQTQGIADNLQQQAPQIQDQLQPTQVIPLKKEQPGLLTGADMPQPSVPISQPQQLDPSLPRIPAPIRSTPQPGLVDEVIAQSRQLGSGALGNATAFPMRALAALTSLVAIPARAVGAEGPANAVQGLLHEAERMQQGADFATGAAATPQTPGQTLARTIGRNAAPSGLMTTAMTGADLLSQAITPSPVAASTVDKPTAEKLLFPNRPVTGPGPRVTHTIKTAGGPASVSDGDLKLLGVMGAVTLGAIFAPSVLARITKTPLPVFRDVENAAPGTQAISNRIDLGRTYDDVNAGVFRVARRAGVDPLTLANVQDTFRIQTGGAARNLVNSAVLNGEMQTPTFTFQTRIPISQLAKKDSPEFRDYLHARDTFDDIIQKETTIANKGKNAVAQQAAIGPVEVRGMTKQDALNTVNALERTNPEFKDLGAAYRENTKAMRQFLSNGQYATIGKKESIRLNRESQNYVPWKDETGRKRVLGDDVDRLSPFDAMKDEMQISMRHRMENEAKGLYIDNMMKADPSLFVKVSAKEATANPNWERNTVTIYRRGKLERYTTDPFIADVLNHDPYAVSGTIAQGLYATKRLMESTATGVLAPWFSVTSALRSWQIGKITSQEGLKPPTLLGMTRAVPVQLYPQLARSIGESLQNGSGGWLSSVLGPQTMQALSTKLADAYDRSFYAQLERVGTHQGSFLQHQEQFNTALQKAAGLTTGSANTFITGYKQFLNAIHNSPSFDFASKNRVSHTLPKLAAEARHLTGDPLVTGQFSVDGKKPIRMDKPLLGSDLAGKAATTAMQTYGFATGVGREAIPWWNITTQGMKRIGQSYVENPTKFVGKTYLYQMVPAAALFMYSRGAGLDPSGRSYSDYQMNGRSEYNKLMNWYIPIPGRPAEDGIEVPRFHELAPAAHMMEVALDHIVRSQTFSEGEDFMRAALSMIGAKDTFPKDNGGAIFGPGEDAKTAMGAFSEAAIVPPTPPLANAVMATQGMVMPQGIFGGSEAYKKKQDPYDQLGGMNATVELIARALGTGMADVIGSGYAAYTQTPEGVTAGVKNAMTEGSKRMIMKTPIVRDVFDVKPPMAGNTRITEELFRKEKVINNLSKYYRTWTAADGQINTKMASERGGLVVENLLGAGPPKEPAGLSQPKPTNPLYLAFMEEVYNKTNKDSPDKKVNPDTGSKSSKGNAIWAPDENGGIGMKSLWRRYGDYSANLKRLRSINDGNAVTWQMQLGLRPEQLNYLKENNVDYRNPRAVRNFYEGKRQEVARQILFSIRAVEEDFSKRMGKPFHIEDLDPYAKGPQVGQDGAVIDQPTTIPPWTDGSGINQ